MDKPLLRLAQAAGLATTGDHEWPEHVDEDIAEFIAAPDARAIFVSEHVEGLIIGPPPKLNGYSRVMAIAKPSGTLSATDWDHEVVAVALPITASLFKYLHTLTGQIILPLIDAPGSSKAAANVKHKLVESERALASLLQHQHVAFVDLLGGWGARAKRALAASDLNELQAIANSWKQALAQLAASNRDPQEGSASEEVGFWAALETALHSAEAQTKSPDVLAVVEALEKAKRFHATHNFVGDTGIPDALTRVTGYQLLFKDLPLGNLLASQTFEQLATALDAVFAQISRRLRMSGYPIQRSVLFVEAIGRDFASVLTRLADIALDQLVENGGGFAPFATTIAELSDAWDSHVRDFASMARDLMRKRAERFVIVRVNSAHTDLVARVHALEMLWAKHDELHSLVGDELDTAFYDVIHTKGLLELDGSEWRRLESSYARTAHSIEREVADSLREKLEHSGTDQERFEVFAQHRAVLSRPEVRSVVHQYQSVLIARVRADLVDLQSRANFLPSDQIVPRVIAMRALALRVDELLERTATVLGSDWRAHADGAVLANDCAVVQSQLDTKRAVEDWASTIATDEVLSGPVFASKSGLLEMRASKNNLHSDLRALRSLGFRFDPNVTQYVDSQAEIQLLSGRILDSLSDFDNIRVQLTVYPRLQSVPAINSLFQQSLLLVRAGLSEVKWESDNLIPFITTLERTLLSLSSRVSQFAGVDEEIGEILKDLSRTPSEVSSLVNEKARSVVVPEYSERVSQDLNQVINSRCIKMITSWKPQKVSHRIDVRNQVIVLIPELSVTLESWLRDLNSIVAPVLQASKQLVAAYNNATKLVGNELRQTQTRTRVWLAFQPLWDLRPENVAEILDSDISRWLNVLDNFRSMRSQLHANSTAQEYIDMETSEANLLIGAKCDMWQDSLVNRFAELISSTASHLLSQSKRLRNELELARFDASTLLSSLMVLLQAERIVDSGNTTLVQLKQANQLLSRFRFAFPQDWIYADQTASELSALATLLEKRKADRDNARQGLLETLKARMVTLSASAQHMLTSWIAHKPLQPDVDADEALRILSQYRSEFSTWIVEAENTQKTLEALSTDEDASSCADTLNLREVQDASTELTSLEVAWISLKECWASLRAIGGRHWFTISANEVKRDMQLLQSRVNELPQRTQHLRAYERLVQDISTHMAATESISLLRESTAIKVRHLSKLVGRALNADLLLEDIWLDLPEHQAIIETVETAEGELQLTKYLEDIEAKWATTILTGHQSALRNLDSVIQLATDHLAAFVAMRASPHFSSVSNSVNAWEQRIGNARRILDQFVDVQRQFLYLHGVLTTRSVQSILPNETRRFRIISDEFTQMYSAARDKPALDFTSDSRIASNLGRLFGQLTTLQRSLSGFLESQRKRFARFFFVGDDDLLEIVGADVDDWGWKHLQSIFPGVANIEIQGTHVLAIKSPEGEKINVDVAKNPSDNVEFLIDLERAIRAALKSAIERACISLQAAWNNPEDFLKWISSVPCQAALVALRANWSKQIGVGSAAEPGYQALLKAVAKVGSSDDILVSRRREAIISELSYQVSHLQPEYPDLELRMEVSGGSVKVLERSKVWEYGYEYVGVPEVLVRTPLTNDFFFSAASAITQGLGESLVGPAGTGKTESVKALGNLFGHRVVVFNCDNTFDFGAVARVIRGCTRTRSWVCFDEFNRLERRVLSSVSQLITEFVSQHTPIFVTMNPGYSGRTLLPPNMRPQFREFVMAAPDSREIAHVLLYAQGLVDKSIGDAAVTLLSRMRVAASKQRHYDWGLRTLKGILRLCRLLHGSVRLACEITVRPRLFEKDIALFDQNIDELFGRSKIDFSLPGDLDASTFKCPISLRPSVSALNRFLMLFTGVVLLGPPSCGKTAVWKELADRLGARSIILDPSAMSKRSVFGWLDSTTREWTDGLLPRIIRQVSNNLRGEQSHPWFVVFDGEIEPDWAEALNSVLDETRQLTLPNGELIPLPSNMHLIFEATNLDAATPATISRCAVISMAFQELEVEVLDTNPEVFSAAASIKHAMDYSVSRVVSTYRALDLDNKYLSLAWALAGDSDANGREIVSQALRDSTAESLPIGQLTDYYVSGLTGQWHLWSESVPPTELTPDDIIRPEVVVTTAETMAHEALLQSALRSRKPLLLVGPPGSGKTMTLFNALRQMPQVVLVPLNFSATSTPDLVVKALELHCEYSVSSDGVRVLSPVGTRWAALFIDEINLPAPNNNGIVPTTQFLRMLIEKGGFYDSNGEFVRIERVQLVGACNPPPGRRALPQRFLRHLAVIEVDYPSISSLQMIYRSFLASFGAQALADPMLAVYENVKTHLPQEVWTPRELTRWTRGIYTAWNATSESHHSDQLLHQLWFLEGMRIFADRLSVETQSIVANALSTHSQEPVSLPGVWTYLMTQRPQFMPMEAVRQFLTSRLINFAEEASYEGDSHLVIHDEFVNHSLRVDRILRQPQGHAIIVGPHCTGKKSLVRFVSWLSGLEVIRLRTHSRYTDVEFTRDLRQVLFTALRRPVCFLVSEDTLLEPAFVERMNSLLANGEVPGLFGSQELIAELEEVSRRSGFTGGDLTSWFRQKVVANLHVVFTTTTVAFMSPALMNRCYMDNLTEWNVNVKKQIARYWTASTDLGEPVVDAMSLAPCVGNEYLELCHQVVRTYQDQIQELEATQRHFIGGGDRLKEAVLEIAQLKRRLDSKRAQLDVENARSVEVLSHMLQNQSEAERKRVAAVEIKAAVQAKTSLIEKRRAEADDDLAKTQPMIEQAARGIKNLQKSQLNELRGFTNPPEPVKITLEAVCIVLGLLTDGSWRQVLTTVRSDEFISRVLRFDSSGLADDVVYRIEHDYMTLQSFTYERVNRASRACGPLLLWVNAHVAYSKAFASAQPLLEEVEKLNVQAAEGTAQLEAIEGMLQDLEGSIENSKRDYSTAISQCESIKSEITNVSSQLDRSQALLESLNGEQERWTECASTFNDRRAVAAGNSFIEAALIAVGGGRDPAGKTELLEDLKSILDVHQVAFSSLHELSSQLIASRSWAVSLIVDPSNRWDREGDMKTTSFLLDPAALLKELDTALRFGQHIVVEHAERYDQLLAPLINREFVRRGVRTLVNLNGEDIDVAPGFRLTLHARDMRALTQNQRLLLSRVTLVDFTVSQSSFEKLVADTLLLRKMPELAKRRTELLELDSSAQARLRALEEQLLNTLTESGDTGLLENAGLLLSLETLKTEAADLGRVRTNTRVTLSELEGAYAEFSSTSRVAAAIYSAVRGISSWDPFYIVDVDWLRTIAERCAAKEHFEKSFIEEVTDRVSRVVRAQDRGRLLETLSNAAGRQLESREMIDVMQYIEEAPSTVPAVIGIVTAKTVDPGTQIAADSNLPCSIVAMGSSQATTRADRLLSQAMELGEWLVIQNIELAEDGWLRSLTRRLQNSQRSSKFRLILTGMQEELVDMPDILAAGRPLSFEAVKGIVPELTALLKPDSAARDTRLCWIHACFSNAFSAVNFDMIDLYAARWFAQQIRDWGRLRSALLSAVYGARISSYEDKQRMKAFMELYLLDNPQAKPDFSAKDWIRSLPKSETWVPIELTGEQSS